MRYGQIRQYDIANGEGIRTSIFVTGCTHCCYNCFNEEYQDFNAGKEWTQAETDLVVSYVKDPNCSGLTLLGGEPFQNVQGLLPVVRAVRAAAPEKKIWAYSGYEIDDILEDELRSALLQEIDILVDGRFIDELRDPALRISNGVSMAFDKRLIGLIIIVGFIAGLVGAFYTHLLHGIQQFVYHYSAADHMSFGAAVARVSPLERLIPLVICGVVGGVGWFLIHRYGKGVVDIKAAVSGKMDMHPITTLLHATLQIITVGIGSPLGREVAPREASAGITTFLVDHFEIKREDRQLLIACAAGAGLAAVYNSPLSAAIFTLETLLLTWNMRAMSAALVCCGLATFVTRQAGVGDVIQYTMVQPSLGSHYVEFSIALGAIVAVGVVLFNITQSKLPAIHRSSPVMIPISIVAFTLVGVMAMYFPEILGNGKAGNELTFTNEITWTYALGLFGTKWVAVLLALAAGAYGGRITPSMMLGSTLAIVFGTAWSIAVAPISLGMAAFVGAVAFLGLAQKMPMTSCVFMLELSRFSVEMLFPIALTMGTALMVEQMIQSKLNSSK